MTSITHKLKFSRKSLMHPSTYNSRISVKCGDVIEIDNGDFRYVARIKELRFDPQRVVSGSWSSNEF